MVNKILHSFYGNKKKIALLIDPDKVDIGTLDKLILEAVAVKVDFFFVGGSLVTHPNWEAIFKNLKSTAIPCILFPGNATHIRPEADAILFLNLISGRNPEYLIGQHVISAPMIHKSGLEVISTSYLLIDGGKPTTVSYISNTLPIPKDKADIAVATALAGYYQGHKLVYLDTGSGASYAVSEKMISAVKNSIESPLLIGGGIRNEETLYKVFSAGADVAVIGTALERNPGLLSSLADVRNSFNEIISL